MSNILRYLQLFSLILLLSCGADLNKNKKPLPVESPLTADCNCTHVFEPVCGVDNRSYANACFATCAKTTQAKQGACSCDANLKVCGDDGITYDECTAQDKIAQGTLTKIDKFTACNVQPL